MASLREACRTTIVSHTSAGHSVWKGAVDPEWTYEGWPHGGYLVVIIADAIARAQAQRGPGSLPDILHISVQFCGTARVGTCEVHVHPLNLGKRFQYIQADFLQNNRIILTAAIIFGVLGTASIGTNSYTSDPHTTTLPRSSALYRRVPLSAHPADTEENPTYPSARFGHRVRWGYDVTALERNVALLHGEDRENGRGTLEWGAWVDIVDEQVVLDQVALCLFVDMPGRLPDLIATAEAKHGKYDVFNSYTTLVINVQFLCKFPFDAPPSQFAPRSVGLYSTSRFLRDGLHDSATEIWTSPSHLGGSAPSARDNSWRKDSVCLATTTQMTMVFPLGVKGRSTRLNTVCSERCRRVASHTLAKHFIPHAKPMHCTHTDALLVLGPKPCAP